MGYGDLSSYGRKDYNTPHLDHLATQGVKLTNAYAAAPVCTPTRTAFLTGKYPARTPVGLLEPLTPVKRDSAFGITADMVTVSSLLKKAGYETALVGKWHLGFSSHQTPLQNGFDYFFGIKSGGADYIAHRNSVGAHDLFENDQPAFMKGYLTDIFESKVVDFLEKDHTKPFFLSIQFNAPHWPWQGPNDPPYPDTMRLQTGGDAKTFAAMMTSLDNSIGRILKTLDRRGLTQNTLVIFTSDNGGERFSQMGPLSKGKFTLWEGGIRVPAFVRWPGKIKPGTVSDQMVITMDWTALILGAANAANDVQLDGFDLTPVFTGEMKAVPRLFFWRTTQRTKHAAVRDGDWKYLKDEKGEYLFHIVNDPGEQSDVKAQHADKFEALKRKYADWEKQMLAPIPL